MIRFLKRLFGYFGASVSPLPTRVADSEPLTRFLFSHKHFAVSVQRVKHQAFTPKNGETSVFRTLDLVHEEIWKLGREQVGEFRAQQPWARADLSAKSVKLAKLRVLAETSLHPRHGNIIGWPQEKEKQRLATIELASNSVLVLPEAAIRTK